MQRTDTMFRYTCLGGAALALLLLAGILAQLGLHSAPAWQHFGLSFLWGSDWDPATDSYGALPHILGTLLTTAISLVLAIPLALAVALFITEVPDWLSRPLSHCINHGINMAQGLDRQKDAVDCGRWLLYNFNPDNIKQGKNPLTIKSKAPKMPVRDALIGVNGKGGENRFKMLAKTNKANFEKLLALEEQDIKRRWRLYQALAAIDYSAEAEAAPEA